MGTSHPPIPVEDIIFTKEIEPNSRILNNGQICPIMGLGTDHLNEKENSEIVYESIKSGTRLIDTSSISEEIVGIGIKRALIDNIVKRKDLFIVAKLELNKKDNPQEAIRESLKKLQLDYVDLYLDHWPSCINYKEKEKKKPIPVKDTWQKMENLVAQKLTKSIGVCNYTIVNLLNVLSKCEIKPAVIEVEFHPYLFQKDLIDFCKLENIAIFAYNPLTQGWLPNKKNYVNNYNILRDAQINYLMEKYYKRVTRGQIILNWHMNLKVIPITGTLKKERMIENLGASKFTLSEKTMYLLCSFEEKQHRFCDGSEIFGIDIFA